MSERFGPWRDGRCVRRVGEALSNPSEPGRYALAMIGYAGVRGAQDGSVSAPKDELSLLQKTGGMAGSEPQRERLSMLGWGCSCESWLGEGRVAGRMFSDWWAAAGGWKLQMSKAEASQEIRGLTAGWQDQRGGEGGVARVALRRVIRLCPRPNRWRWRPRDAKVRGRVRGRRPDNW